MAVSNYYFVSVENFYCLSENEPLRTFQQLMVIMAINSLGQLQTPAVYLFHERSQ